MHVTKHGAQRHRHRQASPRFPVNVRSVMYDPLLIGAPAAARTPEIGFNNGLGLARKEHVADESAESLVDDIQVETDHGHGHDDDDRRVNELFLIRPVDLPELAV